MEIIQFDSLYKGLAHARKRIVNAGFKHSKEICLMDMKTRETMTMDADTAKKRFSHKIELKKNQAITPGELLYFNWVPDKDLPF
jgi:hypothetical protein